MDRKKIVSLVLNKDDKFLLEKRKSSKPGNPGAFVFPCGKLENGENEEEGIKREMFEELDIKIDDVKKICKFEFDSVTPEIVMFFSCEKYSGEIKKLEAESLYWMTFDEIKEKCQKITIQACEIFMNKS